MQTELSQAYLATPQGARANEILRSCVHCGFCNATCPTYQLTGDELDGPRGRIYLIKELLETASNLDRATQHLDRCLTCRACETTCPSGVDYGELAEIARLHIGPQRKGFTGRLRALLRWMVPRAGRLRAMSRLGRPFRWALPARLAKQIPSTIGAAPKVVTRHERRIVLLNGCAQQVATPRTNQALIELLDTHGIGVVFATDERCCGSLDLHLGAGDAALEVIRHNVDQLADLLGSMEGEIEAIVSTASGCGVTIKDYGRLLAGDPDYADKAREVAAKTRDVAEYLAGAGLALRKCETVQRVAWHAPCTLQHGQRVTGVVESLLTDAGYELTHVADSHLCCGSAGTYSVLQPAMAEQLKSRKLDALLAGSPDVIATANLGCQTHMAHGCPTPVLHWIELLS